MHLMLSLIHICGSGIGLSIVKAIMDSHHKECGVRNMEDGVEFWFTLDGTDRS